MKSWRCFERFIVFGLVFGPFSVQSAAQPAAIPSEEELDSRQLGELKKQLERVVNELGGGPLVHEFEVPAEFAEHPEGVGAAQSLASPETTADQSGSRSGPATDTSALQDRIQRLHRDRAELALAEQELRLRRRRLRLRKEQKELDQQEREFALHARRRPDGNGRHDPGREAVGRYALLATDTSVILLDTVAGQTWQLRGNSWRPLKRP